MVWIVFLLYWQTKAVDTSATQRLEARILAHPPRRHLPDRDRLLPILASGCAGFTVLEFPAAGLLGHSGWERPSPSPACSSPCGRACTSGATGAAPSPGQQGHELITTGPYAVVRHSIYTGILAGFLHSDVTSLQVRGFIVMPHLPRLRPASCMEEEWMRSRLGRPMPLMPEEGRAGAVSALIAVAHSSRRLA